MKLAAAVLSASLLVLASADSRGRRPSHRSADERMKPNNGTSVLMSTNKHCLEDYLRPPIEAFGSFSIVSVAFVWLSSTMLTRDNSLQYRRLAESRSFARHTARQKR